MPRAYYKSLETVSLGWRSYNIYSQILISPHASFSCLSNKAPSETCSYFVFRLHFDFFFLEKRRKLIMITTQTPHTLTARSVILLLAIAHLIRSLQALNGT